ncbi:EAL domain-containing protein [Peribacillus sp. B-H-3]|uniref:EAL domain-containing protein n=1 Tax=Peribacillus sp. B-H-3 TaxID=3400420 RepID=UPI003B015744
MQGHYNWGFVCLSILIAVFASFTALDLAGRITLARNGAKKLWLMGGAVTMGLGIWSMHFVAMLAFSLPVMVNYDASIVLFSVAVAILASFTALFVVSRERMANIHLLIGGLFMSTAIILMHYTGMMAMQMQAAVHYNKLLVTLSVFIALAASLAALKISFFFRVKSGNHFLGKLLSAIVMGSAISGMHYTGMAAASYRAQGQMVHHMASGGFRMDTAILAGGIGAAILTIQIFVLFSSGMDRKLAIQNKRLQESQQRYDSLVRHNLDIIFSLDASGSLLSFNPSLTDVLGYSAEEVPYLSFDSLLSEEEGLRARKYLTNTISGIPERFDIEAIHKNGNSVMLNVTTVPVYIDKKIDGIYGIAKDITEQVKALEIIHKQAYQDDLTSLPNRRSFREQVSRVLQEMDLSKSAAIFLLDMDRFKTINDTLGHSYGDLLLVEMASRFEKAIGANVFLARMGGDEFTLFLPNIKHVSEAEQLADKLLKSLNEPFTLNHHEIYTTASIGIAIFPQDGSDIEELLKKADLAMYLAKETSKSNYQIYTKSIDSRLDKIQLEEEMRRGIESEGEFILHYQPKIHIKSEEVTSLEALVRWNHPRLGFVSPADFIPLAEETGLIVPLGEKILRMAVAQLKKWHEQGFSHLQVAVNVATRQFMENSFLSELETILKEYNLEGKYLELEITESTAMKNVSRAIYTFNKLKEMGVEIAIDDFGTGYSSLAYLKDYPINTLKIDQSFIRNLSEGNTAGTDEAITASIISLAKNMQLNIVAEGVETENQLNFLKENDCDTVQGYLFSRPLSAEDLKRSSCRNPCCKPSAKRAISYVRHPKS